MTRRDAPDPVPESADAVLIDGIATGPMSSQSSVSSESVAKSSAGGRWVIVDAAVLVALLIGLVVWPRGDATSPEAAAARTEDREPDPAGTDEGTDPVVVEPGDDQPDDEIAESSQRSDEEAATAAGPLLGEETGLGMVSGGRPLKLLELDTGVVHEFDGGGEPVGLMGTSLVVRADSSLLLYRLDSPEAEPTRITSSTGWMEIIALSEDRVWTLDGVPGPEGWSYVGYDQNGDRAETVEAGVSIPFLGFDPKATVVQGQAGGVYRRVGGRFERVSFGQMLAIGNELVLVLECDQRMSCGQFWYHRDNWDRPLDLPPPAVPAPGWASIGGNDRWLLSAAWISDEISVLDIQTGAVVHTMQDMMTNGPPGQQYVFSPDGRWLVESGSGPPTVVDLDTGTEWQVEAARGVSVLVDLKDAGFAG